MSARSKASRPGRAHAPKPAPLARPRRAWLLVPLLLAVLGAGAWFLRREPGGATAAGASMAVPDPATDGMEAPVRELIARARGAVLRDPRSAEGWGWLAAVLDVHHFTVEAEPCYRRAMELAPQDKRFSYNLAILLELVGGDPAESLQLFRAFAAREPKFPPVHVRIGHQLARQGDLAGAARSYRAALALDPGLAIARRALGQALLAQDDLAGARAEFERVLAVAPADGPTHASLAQLHARLGDEPRAAEAASRARLEAETLSLPDPVHFLVVQQGQSSRLAVARAADLAREGDWAGAARDLELVLRTRPGDPGVHEQLAQAYTRLGNAERAAQHAAEARRLHGGR